MIEGQKQLSMEELFDKRSNQQMITEATAFKTVPAGVYRLRATKYEATMDEKNRTNIWFSVDILDAEGNRKAKGSLKVSPDEGRTPKGYLDTKAKLYGQLTKAVGLNGTSNAGEVIQTFLQTPVDGYVAVTYKGPKDPQTGYPSWNDAQNEQEEADFRTRGYTPVNIIRSLQAVK